MKLQGRRVLVTGASSGIGLAAASLMVAEGATVAITGRDELKLKTAASMLGSGTVTIQGDLKHPGTAARIASQVQNSFGALDAVFANAGISGQTPLGATSFEHFEDLVRTNFTSVFFTLQAVLPLMVQGGAIVLNGSVMRDAGMPGTSAYAGSKAAISAMTRVLAAELAPRGIRVNTVVPGGTRTPIWTRGARAGMTVESAEERLSPAIPLRRFNEAIEIARAVLFLACEDSSGMTASEIVVDGGMSGAPLFAKGQTPSHARQRNAE